MAKIPGQLEGAQLENLTADPTNLPDGRTWLNTTLPKIKTVIGGVAKSLVTEDGTQTLTNKTLTSPSITTPTGIVKGDVGLGNVDNTSDATKNAATATLTNKTLTAPVINAPTGIVKADVGLGNVDNTSDVNKPVSTAQAAADALKLSIANNLSDLNNAATARTNIGLGNVDNTSDVNKPVSTAQATAIALKANAANPALTGAITTQEITTPTTPSAGNRKIYAKSDGLYQLDSTGAESKVGSGAGGGGGINYITNPDAEVGLVGWDSTNAVSTLAGVYPPGATAFLGHSANSTWTRSTSAPLRGSASFLYTKSAASALGDLALFSCSIAPADRARVLTFSFDYSIASGTYADGDLAVVALDSTSNAWLVPLDNYKILNVGTGLSATMTGSIQVPYNCTTISFGLLTLSSSALAHSVKFDNFSFGPQMASRGTAITDWVQYSPTLTNFGAVTGVNFFSRRVGDSLEVKGSWVNGTTVASLSAITLGYAGVNGNVIQDGSKIVTGQLVGHAVSSVASTSQFGVDVLAVAGSNAVNYSIQNGSQAATTAANGNAMGTGSNATMSLFLSVPIVGWSSNTVMSSDTSARPAIFRATGVPTGSIANGAFNVATFPTVQVDNYGKYSAGVYTIPKTGYYDLYASVNITGSFSSFGGIWVGFQFNGSGASLYKYSQSAGTNGAGQGTSLERGVYLTVGTTVQPTIEAPGWTTAAYGGDSNTHTFSIIESAANSSQQIAASESVNASVYLSANQSVGPNNSVIKINFDSRDFDSHGAWDTTNKKYVVPANGVYSFDVQLLFSNANVLNNTYQLELFKNGTNFRFGPSVTPGANTNFSLTLAAKVRLMAGDVIELYAYGAGNNSVSTLTLFSGLNVTNICIARIGN